MATIDLVRRITTYLLLTYYISSLSYSSASQSHQLLIGVHPLDEKYYDAEEGVINCKDGSKSFSRDRLNDDFCDCPDGTDEPGTSACPAGRFYCKNIGSTPRFLFSSRVNDRICDCCDGSDEYDGSVICPNNCITGGNNIVYQRIQYDSIDSRKTKAGIKKEDSSQKLIGLKALVFLQVALVVFVVAFRLFRRRKTRRRNSR